MYSFLPNNENFVISVDHFLFGSSALKSLCIILGVVLPSYPLYDLYFFSLILQVKPACFISFITTLWFTLKPSLLSFAEKKELEQAGKRITELDRIFKRIYVDDINSTIIHKRFLKLPAEYEAEQSELTEFVQTEQAAVDTYERDKADFNSFVDIIRKYV